MILYLLAGKYMEGRMTCRFLTELVQKSSRIPDIEINQLYNITNI